MGCVVSIPERDWMPFIRTKVEERSPVGTQRIVSIPERDSFPSSKRTNPLLLSPLTFVRITLYYLQQHNQGEKLKTSITVTPNGIKIIDTPDWVEYLCIGVVLALLRNERE